MPRLFILQSPPESVASPTNPPIVGIDTNNNLTINGVPTLLIRSSNLTEDWWQIAGYTAAQADVKIQQAQAAGMNCMVGNWTTVAGFRPAPYANTPQDQVAWLKYGLYWQGSANKDENGSMFVITDDYSLMGPKITSHKGRLNLIGWMCQGECDPAGHAGAPDTPTYISRYVGATQYIRAADPTRSVVSSDVVENLGVLQTYWDSLVFPNGLNMPMTETTVTTTLSTTPTPGSLDIGHLYPYLLIQNQRVLANPGGLGWVPSVSTTPLPELTNTPLYIPTQDQLNRHLFLQVAMNIRAFEFLWGPMQRDQSPTNQLSQASKIRFVSSGADTRTVTLAGLISGVLTQEIVTLNGATSVDSANTYDTAGFGSCTISATSGTLTVTVTQTTGGTSIGTIGTGRHGIYANGDQGMPVGFLDVWNHWLVALTNVKSIESVILAPGNWLKLTTTPVFSDDTGHPYFTGIYAAKKVVGATVYVIAINMNEDTSANEIVVSGGTIDVGQTINTATRLFEVGSVSFAGSVITDDFAVMQVHVYQIT